MKKNFSSKELGWMVIAMDILLPHVSSEHEKIGIFKLKSKLTTLLNKAREEDKKQLENEEK